MIVIQSVVAVTLFYDASSASKGTFDEFLSIPNIAKDVKIRSLLSLIQISPDSSQNLRWVFTSQDSAAHRGDSLSLSSGLNGPVSVLKYSTNLLNQLHNQTKVGHFPPVYIHSPLLSGNSLLVLGHPPVPQRLSIRGGLGRAIPSDVL